MKYVSVPVLCCMVCWMNSLLLLDVSWANKLQAEETKDGHTIYNIWPGKPPGETKELPPEQDTTTEKDHKPGGKRVIRITNVSIPQITIYKPKTEAEKTPAIIICPGGGHKVLAYDHEGIEVAEYFSSIGVTAILLKYRVPARDETIRYTAAVQDAQRAVAYTRAHAEEWKLESQKIGILGFSAGGETAARTALFAGKNIYDKVDEIDNTSSRPDFAVLIYPAYLVEKNEPKLLENVVVTKETPQMFFAHAFDDPWSINASLLLGVELKKQNIPCELHIYAKGGHGFGMRQNGRPAATWNVRCQEWMKSVDILK